MTSGSRCWTNPSSLLPGELFVLVHGDLHGRNILVDGTRIVSVIHWDFAGAYPLSTVLDEGVKMLEVDKSSGVKSEHWGDIIHNFVRDTVGQGKWPQDRINCARVEAIPRNLSANPNL